MSFSMSGFQPAASSSTAVGDAENNFKKLTRLLLKVHYPTLFARERVLAGETAVLVPMLRYAISAMSHKLTRHLLNHGFEIYATSDYKFVECVYKVCIHSLHYYPVLTQLQFLNPKGFAERKMVLVSEVIKCCLAKHAELAKDAKNDATRSTSEKKRHREAVQARLTEAAKRSDELVRVEVVGFEESKSSRTGRRGDAPNSSRSSSVSARARSASKTRVPLSASRKKVHAYAAVRPQSAVPLNASTSSAAAPFNDYAEESQYAFASMPDHSVERSRVANGEFVPVHQIARDSDASFGGHQNQTLSESFSQTRELEYSRAHDLEKLRRKEEADAQAEADRIRVLQLHHAEYAAQNSPHVDRHLQQDGFFEDEEEPRAAPTFAAPYSPHQSQSHLLSASQLSMRSAFAAASPHVVGDEHGLNASFGATQESQQQAQDRTTFDDTIGAGSTADLAQLNSQLNQIATRTSRVAQKAASAGSARKTTTRRGSGSLSSSFNGANSQRGGNQAPRASAQPSPSDAASFLTSAAPRLSTPLETQMFAMIENISAKMTLMQSNMMLMEQRMERMNAANAGGAQADLSQTNSHATSMQQHDLRQVHPLPAFSARPSSSPALMPHPSHAYTPPVTFTSSVPPVPVVQQRASNVRQAVAPEPTNVNQLAVRPTTTSASVSGSPARQAGFASAQREYEQQQQQLHESQSRQSVSHPRSTFASHSGHTPVKVVQHVPHSFGDIAATAVPVAAAATHASPLPSHIARDGHSSFGSGPSPLQSSHALTGSASLAHESVIPSTDLFIEQLKARVKQTNDLLGTARMTQRAYDTRPQGPYA